MPTREVPPEERAAFCEDFTRVHHGWLVTVTMFPPPPDAPALRLAGRILAARVPLRGVHVAPGSRGRTIELLLGPGDALDHRIDRVERLSSEWDAQGGDAGLRVEAEDGSVTSLHFRVAARPETLDGDVASVL